MVALKPLCEAFSLKVSAQLQKLKSVGWACVSIINTQVAGGVQHRSYAMLDLKALPGWLFTINVKKVNKDDKTEQERLRDKLKKYQREAVRVLVDHFLKRPSPPASTVAAVPDAGRDGRLVQADLMQNLVVSQIAQEQQLVVMSRELGDVTGVTVVAHSEGDVSSK